MNGIIDILADGDLRKIGRVGEVINLVADKPDLFPEVIQAMDHADPGVRGRASDAVEKITRTNPDFLQPHKAFLLEAVKLHTQQEVRWQLAQLIPRLDLSPEEKTQAAGDLFKYLDDPSKIVQTNSLQALVDLAWEDDQLFQKVKDAVERLADNSSPAVSNRAGKLFLEEEDSIDQ